MSHTYGGTHLSLITRYPRRKPIKPPTPATLTRLGKQWSSKLIQLLWSFSKKVWAGRNAVIHGKADHVRSKHRLALEASVEQRYTAYANDQHFIPQDRSYLFGKDLQYTLKLRDDTLRSWLFSVDKAIQTQQHRQEQTYLPMDKFLVKRPSTRPSMHRMKSLFAAPFSRQYYKANPGFLQRQTSRSRRKVVKCRKPNKPHAQNHKYHLPPRPPVDVTSKDQSPALSLFNFGFTRIPKQTLCRHLSQAHTDQEAAKHEFSGTFLSTTP